MPDKLKGTRPRPRVALIGTFSKKDILELKSLFSTLWVALDCASLEEKIDPKEIDLVILSRDFGEYVSWLNDVHVISFSEIKVSIPGPYLNEYLRLTDEVTTEEFFLPDLPLPMHLLRETALAGIDTVKGWNPIKTSHMSNSKIEDVKISDSICRDGALIIDPYSGLPFATHFVRPQHKLGVTWLPMPIFEILPWVELICIQLAELDSEAFPDFKNWINNENWMTSQELSLHGTILELGSKRRKIDEEYVWKIAQVSDQLRSATLDANKGIRKLITAQGDELVNHVADAFSKLGFQVTNVDYIRKDEQQKLEDLRISLQEPEWEAIIEVRGYMRSGGTTADLARLGRFARHYEKEFGKSPSKMIYVVNGQIELPPYQRQQPLASAPQDVEEFALQEGLIIWSLDLYKLISQGDEEALDLAKRTLILANGRWP